LRHILETKARIVELQVFNVATHQYPNCLVDASHVFERETHVKGIVG
jgi:hypothetical protein